uniref:Secreted protein n=1 Tax=Ditylenchus dipsaci TaxID=166011 RepID=A0A915DD24_9BILA
MSQLLKLTIFLCSCICLSVAQWPRWEERTLDCTSSGRKDQCLLIAPKAKIQRDSSKYKCKVEPMPQHAWNTLAKGPTRLACPIGCEPDADLSVIQSAPSTTNSARNTTLTANTGMKKKASGICG